MTAANRAQGPGDGREPGDGRDPWDGREAPADSCPTVTDWSALRLLRADPRAAAALGAAVVAGALVLIIAVHRATPWMVPLFGCPLVVSLLACHYYAAARAALRQTVLSLSRATEVAGVAPPGHAQRVARLCRAVGRRMRLSPAELTVVEYAALLHDVGRLSLEDPPAGGTAAPLSRCEQRRIARHGGTVARQAGAGEAVARTIELQAEPYRRQPPAARILSTASRYAELTPAPGGPPEPEPGPAAGPAAGPAPDGESRPEAGPESGSAPAAGPTDAGAAPAPPGVPAPAPPGVPGPAPPGVPGPARPADAAARAAGPAGSRASREATDTADRAVSAASTAPAAPADGPAPAAPAHGPTPADPPAAAGAPAAPGGPDAGERDDPVAALPPTTRRVLASLRRAGGGEHHDPTVVRALAHIISRGTAG